MPTLLPRDNASSGSSTRTGTRPPPGSGPPRIRTSRSAFRTLRYSLSRKLRVSFSFTARRRCEPRIGDSRRQGQRRARDRGGRSRPRGRATDGRCERRVAAREAGRRSRGHRVRTGLPAPRGARRADRRRGDSRRDYVVAADRRQPGDIDLRVHGVDDRPAHPPRSGRRRRRGGRDRLDRRRRQVQVEAAELRDPVPDRLHHRGLNETLTDARRALFGGLIDHAPTFPPEELPLDDGLAEHLRVRASDTGWIVNRFVCAASKLAELDDEPLRLSVVLDTGVLPPADPRIEAVEAAGIDAEVLFDAAPEVYCELPLRDDISFRILQLGELGLRAKVR